MTYADLLQALQKLTQEQLQQTVTIYDCNNDATVTVCACDTAGQEDQDIVGPEHLDTGHFYLVQS